jgi:DNA-directed RNA polymerase, mitochondrial
MNRPETAKPDALARAEERHLREQRRIDRNQSSGDTDEALALAQPHLPRLSEAVRTRLAHPEKHQRALAALLRDLDNDVIALCLLQSSIHCVVQRLRLLKSVTYVGEALAAECWGAKLTQDNPQLAKRVSKAVIKRHGSIKERNSSARKELARAGYQVKDWDTEHLSRAGEWGLDLLVNALPDVFCWDSVKGPGRHKQDERRLDIRPEALASSKAIVAEAIRRRPVYAPQTNPPDPWVDVNKGGPTDARLLKSPLIRTEHKDIHKALRAAIRDGTMRPVLDAINTLQSVPWVINRRVLGVMKECLERGISIPGLHSSSASIPMRPDRVDTEQDYDQWRFEARRAHVTQAKNKSRSTRVTHDIALAEGLGEQSFWVPINLDFRSRLVSMASFNYQGDDYLRSLFQFAHGERIGEKGLYWLKVHTANSGDFDKVSKRPFTERVTWVDKNIEHIKKTAQAPIENLWWAKADEPFLFLAACYELSAALDEGPSFKTHLPVSFDGSCSGLQHLCAMTRDPEGSSVNLTPNIEPQDIYQLVADRVKGRLSGLLNEGSAKEVALAKLFLHQDINRGTVKPNVMTYCYGVTHQGMTEQLEDKLEGHFSSAGEQKGAARFLAKHVSAAIKEVIELPEKAMCFLKDLMGLSAGKEEPLRWTTPVGFPWVNRYQAETKKKVRLLFHDRGVKVPYHAQYYQPSTSIDKRQSVSGVAPNFVHACDAAHLMRVVNQAVGEGITQIATVHDSFACLASHAERFRKIIREEFVRMYTEHDVLAEILEQAKGDLILSPKGKWPALPEYGSLDLNVMLNAEYAFA